MALQHSHDMNKPVFVVQDMSDINTKLTLSEVPYRHYFCYPMAVAVKGEFVPYTEWLSQY